MLSWAAENVGLVWNPPPRPDSSRLDEWSLGGGSRWEAESAPLRCHSSQKCMMSLQDCGRNLSLPETNTCGSSPSSPPSMVEPLGAHGHPLGGAVCGHATVSHSRYHSVGWSVSPLTGLFVLVRSNWQCLQILWGDGFCPPRHGVTADPPGQSPERPAKGWSRPGGSNMSCVLWRTSRSERRRWLHSLGVVRCPH